MQKAKRTTPILERAAKVGVALEPTPAGVHGIIADDGASPAARARAKFALRAHMKGAQVKAARAEKRALEQPAQQRLRTAPMQERAAAAGVELPAALDTSSAAGGSVEEKSAIRKHRLGPRLTARLHPRCGDRHQAGVSKRAARMARSPISPPHGYKHLT